MNVRTPPQRAPIAKELRPGKTAGLLWHVHVCVASVVVYTSHGVTREHARRRAKRWIDSQRGAGE